MRILERYIAKTLLQATGLSLLIIVGVLFLMLLLGEMKSIGEGDYGILQALEYVLLRLPNEIYQFSPLLILLGSITGLSILSTHYELIVMRSSGFSTTRIILTVLVTSLLLILIISVTGEGAGPRWSAKAEIHKENAENAGAAVVTAAGVWFHIENNFIHVDHVMGRQLLEGVTRYQFNDDHQLQAAYYAKKLIYQNKTWKMKEVVETLFYPERTKTQHFDESPWDLKFNVNLFNVGLVDPQEMTLPRLFTFAHYLESNGLQAQEYWFDFWQRLLQPLASLVMVLLAVPFVLRSKPSTALGWRVVGGVTAGFAFFILNALLGQLSIVYQVPAFFAALLPVLLFMLVGIVVAKL